MDNKYVNKALELSSKVASNVYLDAISKGLMGTLPILIIGSIGCLLGVFPFDPYLQFIEKIGVKTYFLAASTVTTSCLSIYAAFLIGYRLAGSFKCDQIPAGLISVFAFFITTPLITFDPWIPKNHKSICTKIKTTKDHTLPPKEFKGVTITV